MHVGNTWVPLHALEKKCFMQHIALFFVDWIGLEFSDGKLAGIPIF